jgi:hypothetical protein
MSALLGVVGKRFVRRHVDFSLFVGAEVGGW